MPRPFPGKKNTFNRYQLHRFKNDIMLLTFHVSRFTKRLLIVHSFVFSTTLLHAQTPAEFEVSFNHMAFPVKNLQASCDFYTKVLHLKEITNRTQNPNIRWFSLGDGKELHLISNINEPVTVNKAVHLALSTANIQEVVKHLKDLNIGFSDWAGIPNSINARADGVKQIYFQDPNGYWIEVNNGYVATSKEMNVKDTIWKLEEDYWVYVKNKDFANYLNLWDDNFMGYPSTNIIGGKANITDWITDMYKTNKGTFSYVLERKVENVFGDIVIVLYDATTWWKGSNGEILSKTNYKLTHTWKKIEVGWKIIGGMGGKK
jgi:catechol 2,3-dioxygenase-like lactoylglutathione lyase family enzyme/ketosteroid isomerase-like protein